ncbi:hypothetical protein [Hydrogenophaga flava]|uniref:hypothetical protein n=1 Tax=Hydrogenophaga flava TaxID=65657 RepID=UPI000A819ABF|nr:hypothetical protein [Hydrogenophaga flava]
MATPDMNPEPDNGPDTTPGIPPSRPVPLVPHRVADTVFRPPERDGMSGLSIGLLAAVVVLGLYALVNWPWSRAPVAVAEPATASTPAAVPASSVAPEPTATAAAGPAPVAEPPPPAELSSAVHRCENASQVTYTDGPCPTGMRGHPVDTTTALSVDGAGGTTLFRCRGAGQFWSVVHCQHRGAEIVAMHTVPANLSLAEQILFARNREALARPTKGVAPRPTGVGPVAPMNAAQKKANDCRRLDELVAVLDDYARQPLPPREQDSVRRDRKKARDEQFRLRCGR